MPGESSYEVGRVEPEAARQRNQSDTHDNWPLRLVDDTSNADKDWLGDDDYDDNGRRIPGTNPARPLAAPRRSPHQPADGPVPCSAAVGSSSTAGTWIRHVLTARAVSATGDPATRYSTWSPPPASTKTSPTLVICSPRLAPPGVTSR
jgi:hypothetical protein